MSYKAIIFDFFDVIHSDPFLVWLHAHGMVREGEQAAISKALDSGHIKMPEFYERLGKLTGQTASEVEAEFEAARRLDHETVALIRELQTQYTIAVISNAESQYLRDLIREHRLEPLFAHVTISSEIGHPKPSPEIFEHTLQQLKLKNSEVIFIDDNPANVEAAEALGITSFHYTDADRLRQDLRHLGIIVEA